MYSKLAMDLYGELLRTAKPKIGFVKVANVPGVDSVKNLLKSIYSEVTKEVPKNSARLWPAILGTAAVTAPAAAYIGSNVRGANNEWDKMKYGLGGAALGASIAPLFNLAKGTNLSAYLGNGAAGEDFTSI